VAPGWPVAGSGDVEGAGAGESPGAGVVVPPVGGGVGVVVAESPVPEVPGVADGVGTVT
jgi:hypothetical protein